MTPPDSSTDSRPGGTAIIRSLIAPHKGRVVVLAAVSLSSALLEAFFLVLITGIGMALVSGKDTVGPALGQTFSVTEALVIAAVSLVLRVTLALVGVRISARLAASVTTAQRRRLSHAYLRASWAVQQSEPAGRLQELLTSFVARITATVNMLARAVVAGLSLLAFLATGFALDPLSTAAVIVVLAVVGGILTPLRRALRRRSRRHAQANLGFANAVSELGSLGLEMQAYGAESHFEGRINDLTVQSTTAQRRTAELESSLPHIYMSLAYGAMLAGVAVLSLTGSADLATIGAVLLLMLRSLGYGQQLSTASAAIMASLPFLEDVEDTVSRYSASPALHGVLKPANAVPLVANQVAFAYTAERPALADVTFTLNPGEAIGVIGPSGAGKSTLAQLLLGLRPPTQGSIHVDGVPLANVDHDWWTSHVAFVAQDAKLFTGTVADNIRFFRDGISDADLERAARQANVLTDIRALPDGFHTHLGERGGQLSGGQRQRVSIARALAGRPELLILDEPTSALDGQSEALIRNALAALHGQLSVIIIAHRMSTLDICDRIMVIESGRMTALDTPAALRADSEFYRNALAVAGIS